MSRRLWTASLFAALLTLTSQPALAAWEATPFVGAMIPTKSLILETSSFTYIRMSTHTVYGLALRSEMSPKMGLEVVLGAGTGKMELEGGSQFFSLSSTMYMADLRGTLRLAGGDDSSLHAVVGAGYTDFSVGLFDLADETDQGTFIGRLTGVAGAEVRNKLSDRLRLNVSIVDRIHVQGAGLNLGSPTISEKTQNDICATAGLAFVL